MTKKILRMQIKAKRSMLTDKEIESKSLDIFNNAIHILELQDAKLISIYVSKKDEVQTNHLIKYLLKVGKRIVVPYMQNNKMQMKEILSIDFEFDVIKGIKQPKKQQKQLVPKK